MAELVIKLVNGELAGQTVQSLKKEITAARLEADKAKIGTQQWIDAHQKLDQANAKMGDYKKQVASVSTASDSLKQSFGGLLNQIPGFGAISGMFGKATQSIGGLTSGFGLLKGAIASTGIGLLVIAIATLVDWFTKTDEGATLMSGIFKALGNVTDQLFAGIRALAGGLMDAFKNPRQALSDLVDFIETNLLNRVKAFGVLFDGLNKIIHGDFQEGLKTTADSIIQFNTGIENGTDKIINFAKGIATAVQEGISFEQQLDAIEDKTRELNVTQANTEKVVTGLLLASKNIGLSYEQRIALLNKASAVELKNHSEQVANAKALEALYQKEVEDKAKVGKVTDELDQKLKDATIARINLEKESINLQEKIENRRTQLIEKRSAEEEREAEKKAKALEKQKEDEEKAAQNIAELKAQTIADDLERELEQIQVETDAKIAALVGSDQQIAEQRRLQLEVSQRQMQDIRDKYAKEEADKAKKATDDQKKLDQQKAQFHAMMGNIRLETERDVVQGLGGLLLQNIKDEKAARVIKKGLALVDIGINLVKELSANSLAAAANPLNAITFGAAGVAQLAALNIGSIVRAAIGTATVLAFRKGGIPQGVLRGPSHEAGGIPLVAEGEEIIMTKGVYRNPSLRQMASDINVAGGGRSFAAGGAPIDPFSSNDATQGAAALSSKEASDRMGRLEDAFNRYAEKVDNWASNLTVNNNLQDTEKGLGVLNKLRTDAQI